MIEEIPYGFFMGWNVRADLPENIPYAESMPSCAEMTIRKGGLEQIVVLRADAQGIIASKVTCGWQKVRHGTKSLILLDLSAG